ncbi:CrcB-like protein-domain-containing protein [Nemania abortiva]|nr:CrcB-like protein-domain-containing protein [Nemania abortiva]
MSRSGAYSRYAAGDSSDDSQLFCLPEYPNNLSEIEAPAPVDDPDETPIAHHHYLEEEEEKDSRRRRSNFGSQYASRTEVGESSGSSLQDRRFAGEAAMREKNDDDEEEDYDVPLELANLSDAIPTRIIENPDEARRFSHHDLEEVLSHASRARSGEDREAASRDAATAVKRRGIRIKTEVFIVSHLIFFSILGTLARLGLGSLTTYAASPVHFGDSLWPNFTGTLILGFLSEGSELLHHPRATRSIARPYPDANPAPARPDTPRHSTHASRRSESQTRDGRRGSSQNLTPTPLHIGLATGFCGSFTTFSTFMRDCFTELSGIAAPTGLAPSPGRDFMGVAAVLFVTIGSCVTGLKLGAHIAIFLRGFNRRVPRRVVRWLDYASLVLGIGAWIGAVIMAVVPPDRPGGPVSHATETWRGQVLFGLVFAPVGCLLRFVVSMRMNSLVVGFPLGTFVVNILGTLVLAVAWDLQRLPNRDISARIGRDLISCQVLQGVQDGFCGCLTTVSTWVLELSGLRRRHAYRYGLATLAVGLVIVVTIMGSLKWTIGLSQPICTKI